MLKNDTFFFYPFVVTLNVAECSQNKSDTYGVCVCVSGPNLKVISTMSVGFDHLAIEEIKKR